MSIDIPEDVALRLGQLAQRQNIEIGELLRKMIERYPADGRPWATLADLARHAKKMNMASPETVNTAERSREILNAEYADYLESRSEP